MTTVSDAAADPVQGLDEYPMKPIPSANQKQRLEHLRPVVGDLA
ncbi:hypothetical protein [Magnetovirga frankeli]